MTFDIASIIRDCQSGRSDSFGLLYDAHVKSIYSFIYQRTWHTETAEDLTSQTFFKAWKSIGQFNSAKANFKTWLYAIARNTVIDHYRAVRNETDLDSVLELADPGDLDLDLDNQELLVKVQGYLSSLETKQRQIILMRLWDGLSYQEIADILEIKAENCKMIFYRAITKLRADLALIAIYLLALITNLYVIN